MMGKPNLKKNKINDREERKQNTGMLLAMTPSLKKEEVIVRELKMSLFLLNSAIEFSVIYRS